MSESRNWVTYAEYMKLRTDYYDEVESYSDKGRSHPERLGQYFINRTDISDSEIYYCTSSKQAEQLFLDRYVVM